MSITLTGANGLFTRLGKVAKLLNDLNTFRGTGTIGPDIDAIEAQFTASPDQNLIDNLYSTRDSYRGVHGNLTNYVKTLAANIVTQMANEDTKLASVTLLNALTLLVSQMTSGAQSVNHSVVTATVTAGGSNVGTGVLLASKTGPKGVDLEYLIPETLTATVTSDNQVGATISQEPFSVKGQAAVVDPLDWQWPLGSGTTTTLNAVDANTGNGANLLYNSGFELFSGNQATNWNYVTATPGTTIGPGGSVNSYKGTNSLAITGNGAELTKIRQAFNNASSGNSSKLKPSTVYALNFWLKMSVVPAAGVLKVSLVDGTGTVVNDAAGTPNSLTFALTGATTGFVNHNAFFRTPAVLPTSGLQLQIELTTAITAADVLYLDHLAMATASQVYHGGPLVAAFSGAAEFITGDTFSVVVANTYGAFQKFFDRVFNMRGLGLQLPSSGASTVSDTLMS